ncbi:MAG: hypothetical protein HGB11_08680 [Chlorobiales bacterium]|nr:hypothetical protein [Chlorobiales bacterium]
MKRHYSLIAAVIYSMVGLVGCASNHSITFDSSPQGATIMCDHNNFGYTPQTVYVTREKYEKASSQMNECSAIWSSGYKKEYGRFSTTQFPYAVRQTLERPTGEGYTQDIEFALKVENTKSQKRQAAAIESAADAVQNYNSISPKACKMIGDLSGRIYFFQSGFCPAGYY